MKVVADRGIGGMLANLQMCAPLALATQGTRVNANSVFVTDI